MEESSGLKKGRVERIGAILSKNAFANLVMPLVMLFNSLNTGPFEYAFPLSLVTLLAIVALAAAIVVGPRVRPEWAAFEKEKSKRLLVVVLVVANVATLLPYHPHLFKALKFEVFIMLPIFFVGFAYEFSTAKLGDDQKDEACVAPLGRVL